jgi:hypothetical protein
VATLAGHPAVAVVQPRQVNTIATCQPPPPAGLGRSQGYGAAGRRALRFGW